MSKFVPTFRVNVCFRNVKVTKLISRHDKAETDVFERSNCVYNYDCVCKDTYICETRRCLKVRIRDHQKNSRNSNISHHIQNYPDFIQQSKDFHHSNINGFKFFES